MQQLLQDAVTRLEHRRHATAEAIVAVQLQAYAAEAGVLGVLHFPPLDAVVHGILSAPGSFHGIRRGGTLIGAIGVVECGLRLAHIDSLVVLPAHHRQGIGKALLQATIRRLAGSSLLVTTGAANAPALALYGAHGFRPLSHGSTGQPPLATVHLRRRAMKEPTCQAPFR